MTRNEKHGCRFCLSLSAKLLLQKNIKERDLHLLTSTAFVCVTVYENLSKSQKISRKGFFEVLSVAAIKLITASYYICIYIYIQGVKLKSEPYGPYFNKSNLFTQWQTTPKNLWT
jgi:hypothetical protein